MKDSRRSGEQICSLVISESEHKHSYFGSSADCVGWEIIVLQIRLVIAYLNPAMLEPMDWDPGLGVIYRSYREFLSRLGHAHWGMLNNAKYPALQYECRGTA